MALVLSVTNNSNGTVTIAQSGGGAFVTARIYYAKTTDLAWIELASYVGPGGSTLAIETGVHWFHAATDTEVTSPIMVAITSSVVSVYDRIILATIDEIKSIATAGDLPGLDATKVVRQDLVFVSNISAAALPAIVVTPGQTESVEGGTNTRDDWGYPVEVLVVDTKWKKDTSQTSTYLLWRERIRRHFNFRRLAEVIGNVPEVYVNQVIPKDILAYDTPEKGLARFSSMLTIQFKTREARGA